MASKMAARALGAAALLVLPGTLQAEILLDVKGQSGKFKLYEAASGNETNATADTAKGITITMDALKELDAAGSEVGKGGSVKHSLNSFASTSFVVAAMEHNISIGSAKASRVNFTATIDSVGKIGVETYLVTAAGSVGNGEESWNVSVGDLKWNILFPEWSFCNPCGSGKNDEFGAFLDLTITVQGLGTANKSSNTSVDLGGGASLSLASKVSIDGNLTAMPAGYPMTELQGSKTMTTFRFPKFNASANYDPVITLSEGGMGGADGSAATGGSATTILPESSLAGSRSAVLALPLSLALSRWL